MNIKNLMKAFLVISLLAVASTSSIYANEESNEIETVLDEVDDTQEEVSDKEDVIDVEHSEEVALDNSAVEEVEVEKNLEETISAEQVSTKVTNLAHYLPQQLMVLQRIRPLELLILVNNMFKLTMD